MYAEVLAEWLFAGLADLILDPGTMHRGSWWYRPKEKAAKVATSRTIAPHRGVRVGMLHRSPQGVPNLFSGAIRSIIQNPAFGFVGVYMASLLFQSWFRRRQLSDAHTSSCPI